MVVGDGDRAEVNREQTLGRKLDVEDERIARNRGSLHGWCECCGSLIHISHHGKRPKILGQNL